eukprot:c9671_g1_i1.p1 GENE.c9671_g1_i1~~c9671_g1_i1.p1  ORF type:complete len:656 (+),score=159.35 c9671_g1_i1:34-1968(+)
MSTTETSAASATESHRPRIVLLCHQKDEILGQQLLESFSSNVDIRLVSDISPCDLQQRAQLVENATCVIVLATIRVQRSKFCMEIVNYARVLKKPLWVAIGQQNFEPSSALGAICSVGRATVYVTPDTVAEQAQTLEASILNAFPPESIRAGDFPDSQSFGRVAREEHNRNEILEIDFLISHESDSEAVLPIILEALKGRCHVEKPTDVKHSKIAVARVVIPILSPQYYDNPKSRDLIEYTRSIGVPLVPVVGYTGFNPSGWIALSIAGLLYHTILSVEQSTAKFYDSCPINDFVYAANAALTPPFTDEQREHAEIQALKVKLEELKQQLSVWPPPRRAGAVVPEPEPFDLSKLEIKGTDNLPMNYIHYEITRLSFVPPKPLFDAYGVPIPSNFDVMFSYNWGIQSLVRAIYSNLSMRNVNGWFDIWGDMIGNVNEAMAFAIESSSVLMVFLTEAYQASPNCNMELHYSLKRRKPIILIKAEKDLVIRPWIAEACAGCPMFELFEPSDAGILENGLPRLDHIAHAIRTMQTNYAKRVEKSMNMSEELFDLRELLEDAITAVHESKNTARFKKCTRCGEQFDEYSLSGCKKHSAYMMGGTIIAARWVCCSQTDINSVGCVSADHIDTPREWTLDPNYGTHTWVPA